MDYTVFVTIIALLFALSTTGIAAQDEVYAYHDHGENFVAPGDWGSFWMGCSGDAQSPIDITTEATHKHFEINDLPLILEISSCKKAYDSDMDELDTSPKWSFTDDDCFAEGQNKVPHKISHSDISHPC